MRALLSWVWHNKQQGEAYLDLFRVSAILICSLSHAESDWGPKVNVNFQVTPETLHWLQARASVGPLNDIQRIVLCCLFLLHLAFLQPWLLISQSLSLRNTDAATTMVHLVAWFLLEYAMISAHLDRYIINLFDIISVFNLIFFFLCLPTLQHW